MSKSLSFDELCELVISLGNQAIQRTAERTHEVEGKLHWAIHSAAVSAGTLKFAYEILYVASECSLDSLERAQLYCRDRPSNVRQVVYANSLLKKRSFEAPLKALGRGAPQAVKAFLLSAFQHHIDAYVLELKKLDTEHFIQPTWTVTDHGSKSSPIDYLRHVTIGEASEGRLGVITGEPGQGKTFLTWKLVQLALAAEIVPIYVTSEQWANMSPIDQENLSAVIAYSFRSMGVALDIPPDKADRFIEIFLKAELFAVIFDGFDEYVFRNHARTSGQEALNDIFALCKSTDAPILITSRTTAWLDLVQDVPGRDCIRWSLAPFESAQARRYFDSRFPRPATKLSEHATQLFTIAKKQSSTHSGPDLVGRGFFLPLLYELVSNSGTVLQTTNELDGMSPTHWIVNELCKREEERQKIGAGDWQLRLLKRVAVKQFSNVLVSPHQLAAWLRELGRTAPDIAKLIGDPSSSVAVGRLFHHPLLKFANDQTGWQIPYASIVHYLLAECLLERLESTERTTLELFLEETKLRESALVTKDVLSCVLDLVREKYGADAYRQIAKVVAKNLTDSDAPIYAASLQLRWLCTSICVAAVDQLHRDASPTERVIALEKMYPQFNSPDAVFSGHLVGYDLSDKTFSGSTFDNVVWVSCRFNGRTSFVNCEFIGGQVVTCTGFGTANFSVDSRFDDQANACISRERIRAKTKNYTEAELVLDVKRVLAKLLPVEGQTPRVKGAVLLHGTIGLFHVHQSALQIIGRHLADELSLEGKPNVYRLRSSVRAVVTYSRGNAPFTGVVKQTYNELVQLCIEKPTVSAST